MDSLIPSVHIVSLCVYILALIALTLFWSHVRNEKHWIGFPITMFFFTLHECFEILHDDIAGYTKLFGINTELFAEISEIIGAIILTYSVYYLIKELRKIQDIESRAEVEQD